MRTLRYSTTVINRNFLINVSGMVNGTKVNTLVGVSGAIEMIGVAMFNNLLNRAFASMDDVCVCKLRRGLKFSFYCK